MSNNLLDYYVGCSLKVRVYTLCVCPVTTATAGHQCFKLTWRPNLGLQVNNRCHP